MPQIRPTEAARALSTLLERGLIVRSEHERSKQGSALVTWGTRPDLETP